VRFCVDLVGCVIARPDPFAFAAAFLCEGSGWSVFAVGAGWLHRRGFCGRTRSLLILIWDFGWMCLNTSKMLTWPFWSL